MIQLLDYNSRFKKIIEKIILDKEKKISRYNDKLLLLNPKSQLKRGFSIITDSKKKIVSSTKEVNIDDSLNVQFIDGSITTKVKRKKEYNV
jgi:exonuclease VII large subunit